MRRVDDVAGRDRIAHQLAEVRAVVDENQRWIDRAGRQVGDHQRGAAGPEQRAERPHVRAVDRRPEIVEARVGVTQDLQEHELELGEQAARHHDVERAGQRAADACGRVGDDGVQRGRLRRRGDPALETVEQPRRVERRVRVERGAEGRRHARDCPPDGVRVQIDEVDLREARRERLEVEVVRVAGAEQTEAPAPAGRRALEDLARQPGAVRRERRLVAERARIRFDLFGDGRRELDRLHYSNDTRPKLGTIARKLCPRSTTSLTLA